MNLDFGFVTAEYLTVFVLKGLGFSLLLTLVAMVGGIALGTVLALMRLSKQPVLSWPAAGYVNLMRSVPLVMVILWFFLLLPSGVYQQIGGQWADDNKVAISAFITFTCFEAAYYSEIIRAGIQSVPQGQSQAGAALGMRPSQTMRLVVLPQAFRNMLPVLLTQTIILFQDTSLVYAIGASDLLHAFDYARTNLGRSIEGNLLAAAVYFAICFSLSLAVRQLQKRIQVIR